MVSVQQLTIITYHSCDHNVMETCLKSLRSVSDCSIEIITDDVPSDLQAMWSARYGVFWVNVDPSLMAGRRAYCKLEQSYRRMASYPKGCQVLLADADLYFAKDPFTAFNNRYFDVGLSTRPCASLFPINGGVQFYRRSEATGRFCQTTLQEILHPAAQFYIDYRNRFPGHHRWGLDWWVDQDWLNAIYEHPEMCSDIRIETVHWRYNYSSATTDEVGQQQMVKAYHNEEAAIFHFRGRLKKLIYMDVFEHAVISFPRGAQDWSRGEHVSSKSKERADEV